MRYVLVSLLSALFLTACSGDNKEEISAGRYGMMSTDTPQYTAIVFMRAIYNEPTLDKALTMSTERFARIMQNHHTNKNVQRHLLNLRLDTMQVDPVSGGTLILSDKQKEADIEVKIVGQYDGDQIVDLKTISMVRKGGKWLIEDITNTIP
ncbi:hypothetical protein ACFO4O_03655 [Glaciecola siphonariae]|uniref:Lipoprotein n=1 Tax=Glaciecola siphonariae TaxID=521012 RepID=A0ABV9LRZ8_9ALTE